MYVCLRIPGFPTGAASGAEGAASGSGSGESGPDADGTGAGGAAPGAGGAASRSGGAVSGPGLEAVLLERVPRVVIEEERGVVWADARGLDPGETAALRARLRGLGLERVRVGVAAVPVAAWVAAGMVDGTEETGVGEPTLRSVGAGSGGCEKTDGDADGDVDAEGVDGVVRVPGGGEREFLAPLAVTVLEPDPRLEVLLSGVGIRTCGELAALGREAVEVRFGPEGVRLWRLARADDPRGALSAPRPLFPPMRRSRPHASLDFIDYVITDPERLVFTANALLGSVCGALRSRGEAARAVRLVLDLANGEAWSRTIRAARSTARRETWLRLLRARLERLTVPDSVAGVRLVVEATEPAVVRQGDLFDRGFATAGAVEAALARILEEQGEVLVEPETTPHPLPERRTEWTARPPGAATAGDAAARPEGSPAPRLTLQLLPEPRPVRVEPAERDGRTVPARYRDSRGWRDLVTAAGPDRVSGGQWEAEPYAREYFRCVTDGGVLVWLFRDARRDDWYLHGWWD